MMRPEPRTGGSTGDRLSSTLEDQGRIDQTLLFLRQVQTPDGLHERVEAALSARRLAVEKEDVIEGGAWPWVFPEHIFARTSQPWAYWRVAACALAVGAATLGLVADHTNAVRVTPVARAIRSHSGLDSAAAVRIPTQEIPTGTTRGGRTNRPLHSGRNTLTQRTVLPPGVAVPSPAPALSSTARNDSN